MGKIAKSKCERVGHPPELFSALCGLWVMHYARGELRTAYGLAEQLLDGAYCDFGDRTGFRNDCALPVAL